METEQFYLKIAGVSIEAECISGCRSACENYLITPTKAAIIAHVTDEDRQEQEKEAPDFSLESREMGCLHRYVAEQMPFFGRFVFHGAAITFGEEGYLFTAPSGTGKTTHISLWKRFLGNAVDIVNGDKPILSVERVGIFVHGTPWAGKEGWQKNRSAPVKGLCFLQHGEENQIRRLEPSDCIERMLFQTYIPRDAAAAAKVLELLDAVITSVPLYLLECDVSEDAVRCSFEAMTGYDYEEMRKV